MKFWILNKDFRAISYLDRFCSLLWTERYREYGDMELIMSPEDSSAYGADVDFYLQSPDSDLVMILEDFEIQTDQESGDTIKFTGRSLESILERRIIWNRTTIGSNFQDGIKKLIDECIINPTDPNRKIPNFVFRRRFDSVIKDLTVDAQFYGENLYDAIVSLCSAKKLGFRVNLIRSGEAFDKDCFGNLGTGVYMTDAGTIASQSGKRSETIYIECLPNKTYTLSRTYSGNYWAAASFSEEPAVGKTGNGYTRVATNTMTLTTGQNDRYICIQAYDTDYPSGKFLDEAIGGMSVKCDMGSDYPYSEFAFKLIYGTDRTYGQHIVPRIEFSPNLENIGETNYIASNKLYKSVTLVAGEEKENSSERRSLEVGGSEGVLSGLERREIYTDAENISSAIGDIYDESMTEYKDDTIMNTDSGILETLDGYRTIILPASANTSYKLGMRNFELGMKIRIGAFESYPEIGSSVVSGQKWCSVMSWKDDPIGQYGKGNIDLYNRPIYYNDDGSISTVRSMSFNENGKEVLVPTIVFKDGNPTLLTDSEAKAWYRNTGEYLGKFDTIPQANKYAERLHDQQLKLYPEFSDDVSEDMAAEFSTGSGVKYLAITLNDATYQGRYMPIKSCNGAGNIELDIDMNYSKNVHIEVATELVDLDDSGFIIGCDGSSPKFAIKTRPRTTDEDLPVPYIEWNSHTWDAPYMIDEGLNTYVLDWNNEDNKLILSYGTDHSFEQESSGRAWGSGKLYIYGSKSQKLTYVHIRKDDKPYCYLVPVIDTVSDQYGMYDITHRKFYTYTGNSGTDLDWDDIVDGLYIDGVLTDEGYNNQLYERGKEDLAECKRSVTFDGDVQPAINYIYGKDYFIGDMVTIRNKYGFEIDERVTELIRSEDPNGYTEVPTFVSIDEEEENT